MNRKRATERCVVWGSGSGREVQFLYAVTTSTTAALYDPGADAGDYEETPPYPVEDGAYLLIDNKWVAEK